jgi:hypothetical protein
MRQMSIREMDRRVDQTLGVFAVAAGVAGMVAEQWPTSAAVLMGILVAASFILLAYVEPTFRPSSWQNYEPHRTPGGHHCGNCGAAVAGTDHACGACGLAFRCVVKA